MTNAHVKTDPVPIASVTRAQKRYGSVEALADVTFSVLPRSVVGLLGPNGAGKSTAIGLLLGLSAPTSGSASLFGGSPFDPENRRRVGYLPESPVFADYHTVWRVMQFHDALLALPIAQRRERIARALETAGLSDEAKRSVQTLSKGTRQRLGLAAALLGEPELLVLDEPTSNLDPIARRELCQVVLASRDRGCAVLLSSHVLAEIEATCDDVVILDRGRVARAGTLADLRGPEGRPLQDVFFEALDAPVETVP